MNEQMMEKAQPVSSKEYEGGSNIEKFVQSLLPSMSLVDKATENSRSGDIPYT